ncbi:SURF1 family cytochrome oxidase biogenesis protein [Sphingomonas sp. TDK1]|uniref:SURF1 family cytochrome oxidase biogenesis protein n=1 Tax=Sphingomonas sp. TDK1 TaxID=453247 RepID=UPI002FC325B2
MRTNQPSEDRWYSRDVLAIARARGLTFVAPFFIDADSTLNAGGWPVGGLTVISFPNNHLPMPSLGSGFRCSVDMPS